MQDTSKFSRLRPCPPHGPHLIDAVEAGLYVARCLACGVTGPERKDGLEAKRAFDQTSH
jgi:hypothetical protein